MTPHLADTPVLTTERLTLRAPAPRDADAFIRFFTSERSRFVGGPKTPREAWNFFGTEIGHWALRGYGLFTVTRTGEDRALGMVGHWFPLGWAETEIGWLIFDAADEGTGIAREAAAACVAHAWGPLGWTSVVSYIDHGNDRSVALAEKLGARLDPDAPQPATSKGETVLVYRHPRPESVA
ncbi:N-acetyltransferase [Rhodobacteraceae bacterium CCMM004]|nr:N-acetyltransferase [Rhodobacteraceae bacterium CCMM004]